MQRELRVALFAEDDRVRASVRKALEAQGAEVLTAASGIELLELLGDEEVADVVLGVECALAERAPSPTTLQVLASARTFGDTTPFIVVDEQNFARTALVASRLRNAAVVPTVSSAISLLDQTEICERHPVHHRVDDVLAWRPPRVSVRSTHSA